MPVDESSMSDVALTGLSKLRQQIDVQKELIKKEEAVISAKGDTYVCKRSMAALDSLTNRLLKHDRDYEDRIEHFEDKYRKLIQKLEDELEQKKKETKNLFDTYKFSCTNDMEKHSKMIDSERNAKTPTIVRAEKAIEGLLEKVEKIRNGWNTDVVLSDQSPATGGPIVDWASIAQQQLADMTPAEKKFFEESKNRKPEPEVTYKYKGQVVSKFEYDRFIQQDAAEAYIKEVYPEKKKEPRRIIRS